MILTISGNLGSGKSTVAKVIAKRLGFAHYSTGDFMREMAQDRGISLLELSKIAENDCSVDDVLDNRQRDLGKIRDNFVIDARLAFHFIPESIKVFLQVDPKIGARRIFEHMKEDDKGLRTLDSENTTLHRTMENIARRRQSERLRYKKLYSVDYENAKNYDLVIDTSNISADEVINTILEYIHVHNKS